MHNKLGEFIRMHREGIQPADVGLPDIGRRRTPGLRREELAQLCAVSPTWLTWIEQGRLVSASTKVLAKLADVMRLTAAERGYLFRLADKLDPALPGEMDGANHSVAGAAIVAAIKAPAYILNQRWDAVAWNRPASDLFVGWLAKPTARPGDPGESVELYVSGAGGEGVDRRLAGPGTTPGGGISGRLR